MTTRVYDEDLGPDDVFTEPSVKPTTKSGLPSVYDQMRGELSKPAVVEKTITKKVPARPVIEIIFSTDLPLEKLDRWRVAARKKKNRDEIDLKLFNEIVIASQCIGMKFNGEKAEDESGEPLTFRHQGLIDSLNAMGPYAAIEEMYGRDADILRIGGEVLEAAGYGDDEDSDLDDESSDPLALV